MKFVHNQYKTHANVCFKQPARELHGHSKKLMKQFSHKDIRKNLLEHATRHNCAGPIYGFYEAEIESWPVVCQLNYQVYQVSIPSMPDMIPNSRKYQRQRQVHRKRFLS